MRYTNSILPGLLFIFIPLLAPVLHVQQATAAVLFNAFSNGDFENGFPPWQTLNIGCWNNDVRYRTWSDPSQVGTFYVELGNANSPGGIFQTFQTVPSVTYGVSFWGSGFEGQSVHTGSFAVGSGSFDGVVTDAGNNIQFSRVPSNLLAPTQFVADRNSANNFFGWNTYGGYQFTATSGTSTISFWNDLGNSARVDNVVVTPISGPLSTAGSSGDWNTAAIWSPAQAPGANSVVISGKTLALDPAISTNPASCVTLSITGSGSLHVFSGQSLSIAGSLDVGPGNKLQVDGGASLLLNSASTSRMSGLVTAAGSTLAAATQLVVDSNVNFTGVNLALGSNAPLILASNTLTKTDGLSLANLQATGGSLSLGSGSLAVSNNLEVDNAIFSVKNAVTPQTLTLVNASIAGTGSVHPTSQYRFSSISAINPASSAVWSGSGIQMSIGDDGKGGTVVLTASNTYNGPTLVQNGALQAADGIGLPTASNLVLNGGVLETHGNLTRSLGTGFGQVDWYAGGFSAQGGKLLVTLGNPVGGPYTKMVWASYGSQSFVREGMVLGSQTADSEVVIPHAIDLNGAAHDVKVVDNPGSTSDFATLSGALTNGSISKSGKGTLVLSNSGNTLDAISLNDGILALRSSGALGGTGSITFGGGTLQFSASNTVDYASRIKNSIAAISLDTAGGRVSFQGNIDSSNSGGLQKLGSGTLLLADTDTYGGGTFVSAGTLILASNRAIADRTSLTVGAGGTLIFDPSATAAPIANSPTLAAAPLSTVPEPDALTLLTVALCGTVVYRRLRSRFSTLGSA